VRRVRLPTAALARRCSPRRCAMARTTLSVKRGWASVARCGRRATRLRRGARATRRPAWSARCSSCACSARPARRPSHAGGSGGASDGAAGRAPVLPACAGHVAVRSQEGGARARGASEVILLAAARRGARAPRTAGALRASGGRVTRRHAGAAPGWARGRQTRTPRPRTCARNWPRPRSARTPPAPAWPGAPSGRVQSCGCLRPAPAGRCRLPRTLLVVLCSLHTHGPHAAQCVRMPP